MRRELHLSYYGAWKGGYRVGVATPRHITSAPACGQAHREDYFVRRRMPLDDYKLTPGVGDRQSKSPVHEPKMLGPGGLQTGQTIACISSGWNFEIRVKMCGVENHCG